MKLRRVDAAGQEKPAVLIGDDARLHTRVRTSLHRRISGLDGWRVTEKTRVPRRGNDAIE